MGTEANIPEVFPVPDSVRTRHLGEAAWLRALRDDKTRVEIGLVASGPVCPGWTTRPRTPESQYGWHYLFGSREAGIRMRLLDGTTAGGQGALVWMPPGVPYSIGLDTGPRMRVLQRLRFRVQRRGVHLTPWRTGLMVEEASALSSVIDIFRKEFAVPGAHGVERFRALLLELSIEAMRCLAETSSHARRLSRAKAQRLVDFVAEHRGVRVTPRDLAREARLAPAYFARVFKGTFGEAPRRWLVRERVEAGARLLQDTMLDIGEVARRLGYDEPRLFTRQFRAVKGVTPSVYRRR